MLCVKQYLIHTSYYFSLTILIAFCVFYLCDKLNLKNLVCRFLYLHLPLIAFTIRYFEFRR